jgi:transposase
MDGKVLGIERRRRWSSDEKARLVEETLAGAVVSEVAQRHGVAQSLLFTWRRLARTAAQPSERNRSILLPVEIDAPAPPLVSEATRPLRPPSNGRRPKPGVIEIELGSGNRVRVDADVEADARRRVLGVLGER